MKKLVVSLAAVAMLCSTIGCANGPVRNFLRNTLCHKGCEAPPSSPSIGFGHNDGGCATGNCGGHSIGGSQYYGAGGAVINGTTNPHSTSYANDSFSQGDPYINGSNYGGATINPPVFESSSGPTYGSTIVPPVSSGNLPTPANGN